MLFFKPMIKSTIGTTSIDSSTILTGSRKSLEERQNSCFKPTVDIQIKKKHSYGYMELRQRTLAPIYIAL